MLRDNTTILNLPWSSGEPDPANQTTLTYPWDFSPAGGSDPNQTTLSDPFGLIALFGGKPDTSPVYRPDYARSAAAAAANGYRPIDWFTKNQNAILIATALVCGLALVKGAR